MVKELSILGLRGFGDKQTIRFSIPNGNPGSGITFIVGANNSGKSTILEALKSFTFPQMNNQCISFSEKKRNRKNQNSSISLVLTSQNNITMYIESLESGGSRTKWRTDPEISYGMIENFPKIYSVPSRRTINYEFYQSYSDRMNYIMNQQSGNFSRQLNNDIFYGRIFKMHDNKPAFDKLLKEILGYKLDWTIDQNESGTYYIKLDQKNGDHTSEGLGDGIWGIFTICDALYDSNAGDTITIDEPELSLHPLLQKRLMKTFIKMSQDRQIIISTHSPYFIDINSLIEGASLFRTKKNSQGDIEIHFLEKHSTNTLSSQLRNINQPHTFGLQAREVFFLEENIIIVEGQEDVVIYNKIFNDLGIEIPGEFFGWGAGGADNIPNIMRLFKDLGYERVIAILDNDKPEVLEQINKDYPNYKAIRISLDDVRDKPETQAKSPKVGLVNDKGILKEENISEVQRISETINDYFGDYGHINY